MASRQEGFTLGQYRIMEQIGRGGMATVYKAYQPSMDRMVAIKVLPAHYGDDSKFVERFNREARTIARLEHRNILPVYDFGEENGVTYMAMRYLEGGTLKDVLAQGKLTLGDAATLIEQVCSALDYAHRNGVVHRDVKPANIMVDSEGWAYLTDFGIARVLEGTAELTAAGGVVGTPAYMAPEQSMGKKIDGRADLYAMGIILYEIVVGRVPYQADTPMAVALAHVHEPLPLPRQLDPSIPEPVEKVILKALAKDPADRYESADQLAAAFSDAIQSAGVDHTLTNLKELAAQALEVHQSQIATYDQPRGLPGISRPLPATPAGSRRGLPGWALGLLAGVAVMLVIGISGAAALGLLGKPAAAPGAGPSEPSNATAPPSQTTTVSQGVGQDTIVLQDEFTDNSSLDDSAVWGARGNIVIKDGMIVGTGNGSWESTALYRVGQALATDESAVITFRFLQRDASFNLYIYDDPNGYLEQGYRSFGLHRDNYETRWDICEDANCTGRTIDTELETGTWHILELRVMSSNRILAQVSERSSGDAIISFDEAMRGGWTQDENTWTFVFQPYSGAVELDSYQEIHHSVEAIAPDAALAPTPTATTVETSGGLYAGTSPVLVANPNCQHAPLTSADNIIIRARWGATTVELANSNADHLDITMALDGQEITNLDKTRQLPTQYSSMERYGCSSGEPLYWVHWDVSAGKLAAGTHTLWYEYVFDQEIFDGIDAIGPGSLGAVEFQFDVEP